MSFIGALKTVLRAESGARFKGALRELYRSFTGALQELYGSFTGALQELYRSFTGALKELYRSFKGASRPHGALKELKR